MKLFRYKLLFPFFCVCMFSCSKPEVKNEPVPPSRTDTGANILVCRVDGKLLIYQGITNAFDGNKVTYHKWNSQIRKSINIRANGGSLANDVDVELFTWDIEIGKEYALSDSVNGYIAKYGAGSAGNPYYNASQYSGKIVFRRLDDSVAAGDFSFDAYNVKGEKVAAITDGYFDVGSGR